MIILLAALFIYEDLLFPTDPNKIYPWASDTWGHLVKAVYLDGQLSQGNYYPDVFPAWYSGIQMLRYYAPLPYYVLVGLLRITGDIWLSGNLFFFLTSLGGGLTFLLYRRWLGWLPAVAAGVLFLGLPDNLRVAFAEGNMPRVLATALLPLTFYFLLRLVGAGGSASGDSLSSGRRLDFIGVAACISLVTLSHMMMAAIFLVGCLLFVFAYWLIARRPFRTVAQAVLAMAAGLLISGWWLLPGLTGGISELDQQTSKDAQASFPLSFSLNPGLRADNPEAYYLGLSLVAGLALAVLFWKRLDPWVRAVVVAGFLTGLASSTLTNSLYNALPSHQWFWPIRFLSFAGFAMLLAVMGLAAWMWRQPGAGRRNLYRWAPLALLIVLMIDFNPSLPLVHGQELPQDLVRFSQRLAQLDGWRVATADLSRLGSAPSYLFTMEGRREQVFGWAYQGSITAPVLARVNQGMVEGYYPYTLDRLSTLGTDDIVVLRQPEISDRFIKTLSSDGYRLELDAGDLELYHRSGQPRAYTIPYKMLGIGRGAHNLAMIFPEVMVGSSANLDDYESEFLDQFDGLFLSGFTWKDRTTAEERVRDFLSHGGQRVLVDLSGIPEDILSKQPKFLGVYGEPVLPINQANLVSGGKIQPMLPFDRENLPWVTQAPQGLDETLVGFSYAPSGGTALGAKYLDESFDELEAGSFDTRQANSAQARHKVHFIGLNLVYHALLTHDPVVIDLLQSVLELQAGQMPARQAVPLANYRPQAHSYSFDYRIEEDTQVVVPIAHHTGTKVYIDGQFTPSQGMDRLTLTTLKAGQHHVELRSEQTSVYLTGRLLTGLGAAIVLAYVTGLFRKSGQGAQREKESLAYASDD